MPTTLNVGASRKVTDDNYGSRGASVNLEVEIDSSLAFDSAKLQERIRQLFTLVRQALTEELSASRNGQAQPASNGAKQPTSSPPVNGQKQSGDLRLATSKQVNALYAIAKQRGLDLREVLRERYGLDRPEEFTLKQASDFIGALKSANE